MSALLKKISKFVLFDKFKTAIQLKRRSSLSIIHTARSLGDTFLHNRLCEYSAPAISSKQNDMTMTKCGKNKKETKAKIRKGRE